MLHSIDLSEADAWKKEYTVSEAYLGPNKASIMELFCEKVSDFELFLHKSSIIDVWQGANCVSAIFLATIEIYRFAEKLVRWSYLALSWQGSLWYRNQSIDLLCKSTDWFLYDMDLCHEKVKCRLQWCITTILLTLYFPMFPFDPPENIRKPKVFWCFQGDQKGTLGSKGLI